MKLEICANSFASAKIAMTCGVDRIELCQNLESGGTTPSAGDIRSTLNLKEQYDSKVYVLIRPRTGNFCYTEQEVEVMCEDILFCKSNGADGVVLGALTEQHEIDIAALQKMLVAAEGMGLTFHRAFDLIMGSQKAIDQIINLGFERILTSGRKPRAIEGKGAIKAFMRYANNRISIMAGAGIAIGNVEELIKYTGVQEIHFSGKEVLESKNPNYLFDMKYWQTSEERVKEMKRVLEKLEQR